MEVMWKAHLGERPQIMQAGHSIHGYVAEEKFLLRNLWCLHLYHYEAEITVGEHRVDVADGSITIFPPGASLQYRYHGRSPHYFFHFLLKESEGAAVELPLLSPVGSVGAGFRRRLEEASVHWSAWLLGSEVRLWDALLTLSRQSITGSGYQSSINKAIRYIEQNLSTALEPAMIAAQSGYSQNHLNRLFKKQFNQPISQYVRHYKMDRAAHLIRQSDWPIKRIAAEVGFTDLHHFNKVFKMRHSLAPSRYRNIKVEGLLK